MEYDLETENNRSQKNPFGSERYYLFAFDSIFCKGMLKNDVSFGFLNYVEN